MNYFIPSGSNPRAEVIQQAMKDVAKETETIILSQLNEFVARGLLIVERTDPMIVADHMSPKLMIKCSVVLKIKDQEYIESLERQIEEFRKLVSDLRSKMK